MSTKPGPQKRQTSSGSIFLREYEQQIAPTDKLPENELKPVLMGLFGEVGSLMATAKKVHREGEAYAGYTTAAEEEFGDVLWYLAALCRRLRCNLDEILSGAASGQGYDTTIAASDRADGPVSHVSVVVDLPAIDEALLKLGEAAAGLVSISEPDRQTKDLLCAFANRYLHARQAANVSFAQIARANIHKARGRFLDPDIDTLPTFDDEFLEEEQLPRHFEIEITQRKSGKSYLRWNGVFIGDPLTDNIKDSDGFRFHDVFHMAHAAILHWSPTFRALIKHKRKSAPKVDEAQDGGRAIVVEEGLTAWIFARAKDLDFFEGRERLSFDLLKTVQQFVSGYEVEEIPLKLWERAILDGYQVFRQVRDNEGGTIIGDRDDRTIAYKRGTQ